jgi:hypothetical protein
VVYAEMRFAGGCQIDKLNIETGKREVWQVWKAKDPVGLVPPSIPPAITPDGSKMMFAQRKKLSTLYRSDTLK